MLHFFKKRLLSRNRTTTYKSLVNKNFKLNTKFSKIKTLNVTSNPVNLYISNLKGPSYIMIKILGNDNKVVEASTAGIKVGETGGPYTLPVGKGYTIHIKAGIKGTYQLQLKYPTNESPITETLFDKEVKLTTGWSEVYRGDTNTGTRNLYIQNVSGSSWIMVHITNKDGLTFPTPSSGIKLGGQGGPYHINSGNKFVVDLKAGQEGTYHIKIECEKVT